MEFIEPNTVEYWRELLEQRIEHLKNGVTHFDASQHSTPHMINELIAASERRAIAKDVSTGPSGDEHEDREG